MDVALLFVVLMATIIAAHGHAIEGTTCTMPDQEVGSCERIKNCPSAKRSHKQKRQLCRVQNGMPFFCCKSDKIEKMCKVYGSAVYSRQNVPALLVSRVVVNNSICAQESQELITGGKLSREMEFPHMAALGYGEEGSQLWLCGGSLISERYILTAAHCIASRGQGKVKWALLGVLNYMSEKELKAGILAEVMDWIKHPGYDPPARYNDIALLKLKEKVIFSPRIRPACLNTNQSLAISTAVVATGWGSTEHDSDLSPDLRKAGLRIVNSSACDEAYKSLAEEEHSELSRGFDKMTMICAGDSKGSDQIIFRDTCGGDSGGPIQVQLVTPFCTYGIVGVTSFGATGCGLTPTPAVYTRVSYFVPWIQSVVWPK